MYTVLLVKIDGTVEETSQAKTPSYEQIKKAVGGYIEAVPHFRKYFREQGPVLVRGTAYVNEEGLINGLPFNEAATKQWLLNLGKGPFRYTPRLHGPMIYWAKVPKIKDAPPIA